MSILLSGPARANKSAISRQVIADNPGLWVAADFQAIVVALTLAQRGPDGRYPMRDLRLLPLAEYVRRTIISQATQRGIDVVATNSDGDPRRRQKLLGQLSEGSKEVVVDPGIEVVRARLADPLTGMVSEECGHAINRWYGGKG